MVNKRQYLIHAITAVAVCMYDTGGVAETLQKCEFFQLGRRRNGTSRIVETSVSYTHLTLPTICSV